MQLDWRGQCFCASANGLAGSMCFTAQVVPIDLSVRQASRHRMASIVWPTCMLVAFPCLQVEMAKCDPNTYLFRKALYMPGWNHGWANILQSACYELSWFADWLKDLKAINRVWRPKSAREAIEASFGWSSEELRIEISGSASPTANIISRCCVLRLLLRCQAHVFRGSWRFQMQGLALYPFVCHASCSSDWLVVALPMFLMPAKAVHEHLLRHILQ